LIEKHNIKINIKIGMFKKYKVGRKED